MARGSVQPAARGAEIPPPAELIRLHRHSLINLLVLGGTVDERARIALAFHRESPFKHGPFITLNGELDGPLLHAALQGALSNSERALGDEPLRASEGGTLFIDVVNGLSLSTQRLLLGFSSRLPARESGGSPPAWVGRLAVGSAVDLADEVAAGRFLSALLDSIDKIRIDLPPASGE